MASLSACLRYFYVWHDSCTSFCMVASVSCRVELRMLTSKLVALCVCPALLVPPVVLAVHKPARHAVARILHRAADRLDQHRPPPAPVVADVPCTPTFADAGTARDFVGNEQPGGRGADAMGSPDQLAGVQSGYLSEPNGKSGGGFGGPDRSYGGGGAIAPGPAPVPVVPGDGSPVVPLPPLGPDLPSSTVPGSDIPVSGVPEPESWALMLLGFGMVGGAVRWRIVASARRSAATAVPFVASREASAI